jgi:long-chain fatty acid transport protein
MSAQVSRSIVAAAMLFWTAAVFGGAIDVPQMGTRGAAQADAFSAQADDATAIFYNPAGLTQLHGANFSIGLTMFFPDWHFDGTSGAQQSNHLPSYIPNLYAESDFGLERWRFGIGLNNPFGLNESWGNTGQLSFLVTKAHLFTFNLAPSVAYKINDQLSVGVDLNIYWADLETNRQVMVAPAPTPLGQFHYHGQDVAFGATPGLLWKIDPRNTIGLVYRSPFEMNFSGNASVKTPGLPEVGPSQTNVNLKYPQQVTLAYAMRPVQPLKIEADVEWTDWDVVKQFTVTSSNPAFSQVQKTNWESGFAFRLGGQYDLGRWAFRAGYAYGQRAVPGSTFTPLVPDSNYHLFAAGVGYAINSNITIDAAYQFIYRENRNISNSLYSPLVDGKWENTFHTVVISANFSL